MEQEAGKNSGGLTIPKHRFDCVSLYLKDTKQILKLAIAENEALKQKSLSLESELVKAYADKLLAEAGAKNIPAARALLDFSKIHLEQDDVVSGIEEQIDSVKNNQEFLFEKPERRVYVLVPLEESDRLLDSVQNFNKEVKANECGK